MDKSYTNALIDSASPYLLQHAHNPVQWLPWNNDAIEEAKKQDKLVLVSIGYAACHWCHVMAHESFEDEQVAQMMNDMFICIKVDREERPDVDHYYMTAVQLMGQQGGWPLNVIALPDGKPVWGGTYFPKDMWLKNIEAIAAFYKDKPDITRQYAHDLQNGISRASLAVSAEQVPEPDFKISEVVNKWKNSLDFDKGGRQGQPKFPMPVNLDFLLYFGKIENDTAVLDYVKTTLLSMARGGIYDQIGGGFARYSVDAEWKVPHFEKMLYDNGQLISIYSKGYKLFGHTELKRVVYETIRFLRSELMDETGAFYSSLDADSEGEEGKYYVWTKDELIDALGDDFSLFSHYFSINESGYWEKGNYILIRLKDDRTFASEFGMTEDELSARIQEWKEKLLSVRSERIKPGLDDKTIFSWNALVVQGLCEAYKAFEEPEFKELAVLNGGFLIKNMINDKHKIYHVWKKGMKTIPGFMEDYALGIQAFISLFEITGEDFWLTHSRSLLEHTLSDFWDESTGQFFYSAIDSDDVVVNYYQNEDNVIPSSNSVMANNLHQLYLLLGNVNYRHYSERMLKPQVPSFMKYPMAFANWAYLMLKLRKPYFEVAVTGRDAQQYAQELNSRYLPNAIVIFSTEISNIPLLKDRITEKTLIYVCREGRCNLPVEDVQKALDLISVTE